LTLPKKLPRLWVKPLPNSVKVFHPDIATKPQKLSPAALPSASDFFPFGVIVIVLDVAAVCGTVGDGFWGQHVLYAAGGAYGFAAAAFALSVFSAASAARIWARFGMGN
jgi:hypothetical protein